MLKGNGRKKKSLFLQIFNNRLIAVLDKLAGPRFNLACKVTLCINILTEGKPESSSYPVVVLTKGRRCMNYSSTVCKCYIVVCNNVKARRVVVKEIKKAFIPYSLKVSALKGFEDFIILLKQCFNKGLGEYKNLALIAYLYIVLMCVYNKGNIGWKCPGCCCPRKDIFVLLSYDRELSVYGKLLDILIALCNLMA